MAHLNLHVILNNPIHKAHNHMDMNNADPVDHGKTKAHNSVIPLHSSGKAIHKGETLLFNNKDTANSMMI